MAVSQAVEKFAVFNHSRKYFPSKGDFQRKTHIFYAAVSNEKCFSTVPKLHRCNQIESLPRRCKNCGAINKEKGGAASNANDNFLITVRFHGSFSLLVTVLFIGERS